jgi:hypothetical protein
MTQNKIIHFLKKHLLLTFVGIMDYLVLTLWLIILGKLEKIFPVLNNFYLFYFFWLGTGSLAYFLIPQKDNLQGKKVFYMILWVHIFYILQPIFFIFIAAYKASEWGFFQ